MNHPARFRGLFSFVFFEFTRMEFLFGLSVLITNMMIHGMGTPRKAPKPRKTSSDPLSGLTEEEYEKATTPL